MMKRTLVSLGIAAALTACNSDESNDTVNVTTTPAPSVGNAYVRVWHASPDAPAVNVYVDGSQALSNVDYRAASVWLPVAEGEHNIQVRGITPNGEVTVINSNVTLMADYQYEIAAVNNTANISAAVISKMMDAPDSGNLQVQVAHLSPQAPQVDVHVSAPDTPLSNATKIATLAFGEHTDELEIPAGDYQIRITPAGDVSTVVYDSGSVSLAADSELFISALTNTDANDAVPVSLVVSTGSESFNLYDANQGADLTVVHNSYDTPNVDISADNFNSLLVSDLAFKAVTEVLNVPAATYNLDIGVHNSATSALAVDGLALENGMEYTAIAMGSLVADSLEVLALSDSDNRSEATHAKVRIVHGSTQAGLVDIYVTAQGDTDLSDNSPAFASVGYKADTGYVDLAPGNYTVHVTLEDTTTVAIQADLTLAAGDVYTAIARDPQNSSDSFGLILY